MNKHVIMSNYSKRQIKTNSFKKPTIYYLNKKFNNNQRPNKYQLNKIASTS